MPKPGSSTQVTIWGLLLVSALALPAIPLAAQTPEQRRVDSLELRLEDAEEMLQMLRQQIASVAEAGVQTQSRVRAEVGGRVLMNIFQNDKETNNSDVPMYRVQVPDGSLKGGFGMSVRQTVISASVIADDVWGGTFHGDVDVDFFGGQMPSPGGRTFPLMRIRTARAMVTWPRAELMVGQEQPLVAGLNPISLAAVGAPNFSYSGNLWLWIPQVRFGVHTGGNRRFGVQGAILAPTSGDPFTSFVTGFDIAERSGTPSLQSRGYFAWGDDDRRGEVGLGLHYGQLLDTARTAQTSSAATLDFAVPLPLRLELRGEAFYGQALSGLGGGGIGRNFAADSIAPLKTVGGWAQLNYRVSPRLTIGAGYGLDDPDDAQLTGAGVKLLNATQAAHVQWRPAGPVIIGFEYRSVRTRYDASDYPNRHLNLAFGFEF
jgi:hypothetical protein